MLDIELCRICLSTEVKLFKYDSYYLKQYYEEVMAVRMNVNDGLAHHFCYECASMLHKFHKFREKCYTGQQVLTELLWKGPITIKSIANIDRDSNNLKSPIDIIKMNKKIKTCLVKSGTCQRAKRQTMRPENNATKIIEASPEIEEIKLAIIEPVPMDCDSDDSLDNKNLIEYKNAIIIKDNHKNDNNINDKERLRNEICIKNIDDSTINSDDDKLNSDIFKEEVINERIVGKKKSKGKTSKIKNNQENKLKKFEVKARTYLDPEHWLKINLSEEDAVEEFKAKAQDPKYLAAAYKCTDCYKVFSQEDMLKRHTKLRHCETLGTIVCRFCSMRFKRKHVLTFHISRHYTKYKCLRCEFICPLENTAIFHNDYHNGVMRRCVHCCKEFRHLSTYYTHLRTHRSEHVCTLCGASFVSEMGLKQHKRTMHVDALANPDEEDNTYCERCDISFETRNAHDEHVFHSTKHAEGIECSANEVPIQPAKDPNRLIKSRRMPSQLTNAEEESNKYCGRCDIRFKTRKAYEEHVLQSDKHEGIEDLGNKAPAVKPTKNSTFSRKSQSNPRILTPCSICNRIFPSYMAYTKHHAAEHSDMPVPKQRHICEICGASLAPGSITSHANIHSRKILYACDICRREFSTKGAMTRHRLTHTGEKPVPCKLCDKRFTQIGSMMLHYRTFHLKQPYPKRNRHKKGEDIPKPNDSVHSGPDSEDDMTLDKWRQ